MNLIEIAGHLGADPEERFTSNGKKVVNMRVAVKGRRKDETLWFRVVIWEPERFERMLPYFSKGKPIIVVGELNKPEVYTDRNGQQQVSLEVVADIIRFSPFGRSDGQESGSGQPQQMQVPVTPVAPQQDPVAQPVASMGEAALPDDDNLPF